MKIYAQKFKTYEGARKRAAFENAIQPSEVNNGHRLRAYHHTVVQIDGFYRVQRVRTKTEYQPKTGEACSCKPGIYRDNCPQCEGTGMRIDFKAIRTG